MISTSFTQKQRKTCSTAFQVNARGGRKTSERAPLLTHSLKRKECNQLREGKLRSHGRGDKKSRSPEECERHTKSSRGKSRKSTCFHPVAKKTLSEWQRHCSVKCHCWVKNSSENSSVKKDEPKMELTFRNALTFWNVEIIEENPWTRSNFRNVFFSTHPRKWPSVIRGAPLVHCSKFTTEVTKLKH